MTDEQRLRMLNHKRTEYLALIATIDKQIAEIKARQEKEAKAKVKS